MKKRSIKSEIKRMRNAEISSLENLEQLDSNHLESYINTARASNPALAAALTSSKKGVGVVNVAGFRAPNAAAQMNFRIIRNTAAIALYLPVPLFGVLSQESDWASIMAQELPASDITYTVTRTADRKGLRFTYTQGANVDTIDVFLNELPYTEFLRGLQTALMKLSQTKMRVSALAAADQFAQSIKFYDSSQFGRKSNDSINPDSFDTDLSQKDNIRIITTVIDIDPERTMVFQIKNTAALTTSLNTFVQKFEKAVAGNGF